MKKFRLFALLLALSLFVLAGCSPAATTTDSAKETKETEDAGSGKIKIGGIGPTSGGAAEYGESVKFGAEIAVEEINALNGLQLELRFEDDEHDPEISVNAYNNLKDWGMQVLMGTVTTGPGIAVSSEAYTDRIFMLTPSASSTEVIEGKDNVFQMCFTDPNQGIASAQYILDNNLGSKIAIIYNNADPYSTGIYNKFVSEAEAKNLEIVNSTTFTDDTASDFSVQLTAAKNAGADLIFLPIYYEPASLILTQASDMGYSPKFFGVDGMDGILDMDNFNKELAEGVMLLTPFVANADDSKTQSFVEKYKAAHNGKIPNQFAADGYDCIYAIFEAVKKAGVTEDMDVAEICDKLITTFTASDFKIDGLTGEDMTWDNSGEVSKAPKGMVIEDGGYVGM